MTKQHKLPAKQREDEALEELRKNPVRVFRCDHQDCKEVNELTFLELKKHVIQVHGLADGQLKGTRQMILHIDFDKHYTSTFVWTLESGLVFYEYQEAARDYGSIYGR